MCIYVTTKSENPFGDNENCKLINIQFPYIKVHLNVNRFIPLNKDGKGEEKNKRRKKG